MLLVIIALFVQYSEEERGLPGRTARQRGTKGRGGADGL